MEYTNRLYTILYPNPSLVGSQLEPKQFAFHYVSGSTRHYSGKVIFAEIDINYRHEYFDIEEGLKALKPHEDGRPKCTKFISIYRILEHLDFSAIKALYLTTPEGDILQLNEDDNIQTREPGLLRVFAEINPMRMLVMTKLNFIEFGQRITDPANPKSAPRQFYTQLQFEAEEFLDRFKKDPFLTPRVSGLHPAKIRDAIIELQNSPFKDLKGLALDTSFNDISYKLIRHGFMFASSEGTKFFRMPTLHEIEANNLKFFRAM